MHNIQKNLLDTVVETARLRLVPISYKYSEIIFFEFTERVTKYLIPKPTGDIVDTENFISESLDNLAKGTDLQLVVLEKKTGEFLGCAGLHHLDTSSPEPGIWLKKSAQGMGYGFETVAALKKWADENLQYEYLYYPVEVANIASRRIPEKLGGKLVREFKKENTRGEMRDMVEYRIYP
jgi:ribosomal-protein-alanine N-acetyltransferase